MEQPKFGPQEPPDDPRIFNRAQPDGTLPIHRPLSEFFERSPNMTQHTPYLLTGSGDGPYEIQQGDRAVALLRKTTFEVATHITRCLNTHPDLLDLAATTLAEWHAKDSNFSRKEPGRIKAIRESPAYEMVRQAAITKARP